MASKRRNMFQKNKTQETTKNDSEQHGPKVLQSVRVQEDHSGSSTETLGYGTGRGPGWGSVTPRPSGTRGVRERFQHRQDVTRTGGLPAAQGPPDLDDGLHDDPGAVRPLPPFVRSPRRRVRGPRRCLRRRRRRRRARKTSMRTC
ncbi:hypothetical protein AAG570_006128 [Ranatra chinensis]|uniref:Uncharacterized protein n=1 Tax=Ranatra chinensis TaxID=642074 RepID=A0ABD0XXF2_9HEMI